MIDEPIKMIPAILILLILIGIYYRFTKDM